MRRSFARAQGKRDVQTLWVDSSNLGKAYDFVKEQVKEIAETKMEDLNAYNIEGAVKIIEGTARSMGVQVEGQEEDQ